MLNTTGWYTYKCLRWETSGYGGGVVGLFCCCCCCLPRLKLSKITAIDGFLKTNFTKMKSGISKQY